MAEGLEERARQWLKDHNWAFEDLSERDLVANEMAEFAAEVRRETMEQAISAMNGETYSAALNPQQLLEKAEKAIRSRMDQEAK